MKDKEEKIKIRAWDKKEKREKRVIRIDFDLDNPNKLREVHTYPIAVYGGRSRTSRSLEDIEILVD